MTKPLKIRGEEGWNVEAMDQTGGDTSVCPHPKTRYPWGISRSAESEDCFRDAGSFPESGHAESDLLQDVPGPRLCRPLPLLRFNRIPLAWVVRQL